MQMRMILGIVMGVSLLVVGCSKQPLTLDENTSMKTLLRASDKEITELVMREVAEKMDLSAEDVSVEYILRDKDSQALAVKVSKKQ
jgi:alpha-D-ribose 1-methylphosphonate 5-triphosphate synthase subunit PhnI